MDCLNEIRNFFIVVKYGVKRSWPLRTSSEVLDKCFNSLLFPSRAFTLCFNDSNMFIIRQYFIKT